MVVGTERIGAKAGISRVGEAAIKAFSFKMATRSTYGNYCLVDQNGALTIEDIEDAALAAINDFGRPDPSQIFFVDEHARQRFLWSLKFEKMSEKEKQLYRLLYNE